LAPSRRAGEVIAAYAVNGRLPKLAGQTLSRSL